MSQKKYESVAKADNNPNPTTNPKLKRICEQLRQVRKQITDDMSAAALDDDWEEIAKLSLLDDRAQEIMRKIGCGGISIVSTLDQLIMDNFIFTK